MVYNLKRAAKTNWFGIQCETSLNPFIYSSAVPNCFFIFSLEEIKKLKIKHTTSITTGKSDFTKRFEINLIGHQ
jgi:hypothetical protein